MNIFIVDECPIKSAKDLCDKHVVKMITESAQMLSTAHRVLDGKQTTRLSDNGRKLKYWQLDKFDDILYKASHVNHPCNVWIRESADNYNWLYKHYAALNGEFNRRYKKEHKAWTKLYRELGNLPKNIPDIGPTPFKMAMNAYPELIVEGSPVESYRNLYRVAKKDIATWNKGRPAPSWFNS